MKLYQHFSNPTIRTKILVPFLLIIFGTGVLGTWFFARSVTNIMRDSLLGQLESHVERLSEHLIQQEQRLLFHAQRMADIESQINKGGDARQYRLRQINELQLMNEKGINFVETSDSNYSEDSPYSPLIRLGLKGLRFSSFLEIPGRSGNQYMLGAVAPLPSSSEKREVVLLESQLDREYMEEIKLGKNMSSLLLDRFGKVLVGTMAAGIENHGFFSDNDDFIREMSHHDRPVPFRFKNLVSIDGELYLAVAGPFKVNYNSVGAIAVVAPWRVVVSKRQRLILKAMILAAVLLFVMTTAYLLIVRTFTNPLQFLETAAKKMARGEPPGELPTKAANEIGTLARSFENMSKSLEERQDELLRMARDAQMKREELDIILENMADGVVVVSKDYEIEYMNKAAESIFGEKKGGKCFQRLNDRDSPCAPCSIDEILIKKQDVYKYQIKTHKGRYYEVIARPLKDLDGQTKIISLRRDVTERIRFFDEQKKMQETVQEERISAIKQVSVSIKHRINNSLAAISSSLSFLRRSRDIGLDNEDIITLLLGEVGKIQQTIARLEELTDPVVKSYANGISMIDLDNSSGQEGEKFQEEKASGPK